MSSYQLPCMGQRFTMLGGDYEVSFVQLGIIRYSSVIGGKIHKISVEKFENLKNMGRLVVADVPCDSDRLPDRLTKKEISIMNNRLKYVREILKRAQYPTSKSIVTPLIEKIANETHDKKPPGFSSFARWMKSYRSSGENPMSLAPACRRGGNVNHFDPVVERVIQERIDAVIAKKQRLKGKDIHSYVIGAILEEYGDSLPEDLKFPSLRTINRRIEVLDPYKRSRNQSGKYVADKKLKAAGKSLEADRILEVVEADGHILDIIVIDEDTGEVAGRPYGTVLFDRYSRCVVAFVITMIPFSAPTLLRALKIAVSGNDGKIGGLFEQLAVDNGPDYISYSVKNFCNDVGIRLDNGEPRNPDTKPFVERFFGTLNSRLVHSFPGTTYSNPTDKGDYDSDKYACATLDEAKDFVDEWLETDYHRSLHTGLGRVPEKVWEESIKDTPVISYPIESLEKIARDVSTRVISKGRVKVHNLQWYSHALTTIEYKYRAKGQKPNVQVYIDSLDLGKVFIKEIDDSTEMIQADSTKPSYAEGLSLYEHELIQDELKERGRNDLSSYDDFHLEKARWNLWKKIVDMGEKFAKKKLARLKEVHKKNQKSESTLIGLDRKKPEEDAPSTTESRAGETVFDHVDIDESENVDWDESSSLEFEEIFEAEEL